jgi:hypothetical protein
MPIDSIGLNGAAAAQQHRWSRKTPSQSACPSARQAVRVEV